ncbi:hypothetical protein FRC03_004240 [Tulasnella sp. 419]|nr:hypothetical protein FRC03_004240 [Tulasnella sp. 419]
MLRDKLLIVQTSTGPPLAHMDSEKPKWKDLFARSSQLFKEHKLDESLQYVSKAIKLGADKANVFDLRADIYEQKGEFKQALVDAKNVIKLAPSSPQGYWRSARLFKKLGSLDRSMTMANLALEKLSPSNSRYPILRPEIDKLLATIGLEMEEKQKTISRQTCHVANLPFELLAITFELVTDVDSAFPVLASHVCRHWRQVALNHAVLWRTLVLSNRKPEKKAEVWGVRSNSVVDALIIKASMPRSSFEKIVARLLPSMKKWPPKKIQISDLSNPHLQLKQLSSSLGDAFDPLEIKLSGMDARMEFQYPSINNLMPPGSRRTLLHLEEMKIRELPLLSKGVRTLVLSNIWVAIGLDGGAIVNYLTETPDLEHLVLGIHSSISVVAHTPSNLTLTRLQYLQISSSSTCSDILPFLGLPSLKILHLFSIPGTQLRQHLFQLNQSINLPSPSLQELRIRGCSLMDGDLIKIIALYGKELEVLEASSMSSGINSLVQAMAGRAKEGLDVGGTLCPSVRELVLNNSPDLTGLSIKDLVKSRESVINLDQGSTSAWPTPITRLSIDGCPRVESALLPWLRGKIPQLSCIYETASAIRKTRRLA